MSTELQSQPQSQPSCFLSLLVNAARALILVGLLFFGTKQDSSLKMARNDVLDSMRDAVREAVHVTSVNLGIDIESERVVDEHVSDSDQDDSDQYGLTPLEVLTRSSEALTMSCPSGMVPVQDTLVPRNVSHPVGRRIPRIVHVTSKSRCVSPQVGDSLERWRFPNHAFYFHDDEAVMSLLNESWVDEDFRTGRWPNETSPCTWEKAFPPNMPPRDVAIKCATAGATKADLWRYAVLWRYGGIYTDIDNTPNKFNGKSIQEDDDSFMILEKLGIIAQYFLTSSPRHPYMMYTMNDAMDHLRQTKNVMVNVPEKWTGPGAIKRGFCFFMEAVGIKNGGYIEAGMFVGAQNRSVRVVGHKGKATEYVDRYGIGKAKTEYYKLSNITHFGGMRQKYPNRKGTVSCEDHIQRTKGDLSKVALYEYSESLGKYVDASAGA